MQSHAVPPGDHHGLLRVLTEAQRIGTLGPAPLADIIRHATWFADAVPPSAGHILDLGSGAGIPGLVVALVRPDLRLTLVDRRVRCTDTLRRAIVTLDLGDRVQVVCDDVQHMGSTRQWQGAADGVMSRGFGPPVQTLAWSLALVRTGGVVIISEPPADTPDRWQGVDLVALGVGQPQRVGPLAVFHVEHQPLR